MGFNIHIIAFIASAFFLTYTFSTKVTETNTESRLNQVLTNLTAEISGISNRLKNMRKIAQSSEETSASSSKEVSIDSGVTPPHKTNVTYEDLLKRTEEARKKVKEMQMILKSVSNKVDTMLKKEDVKNEV